MPCSRVASLLGLTLAASLLWPLAPARATTVGTLTDVGFGGDIYDSTTGLEWLPITATQGLSFNTALTSAYVTTGGYSIATHAQLLTLMADAFGTPPANCNSNPVACSWLLHDNGAAGAALVSMFGLSATNETLGVDIPAAYTDGANIEISAANYTGSASTANVYAFTNVSPAQTGFPGLEFGIFMEKSANAPTAAPEPASIALLGLAWLGIGATRRRRRDHATPATNQG